MSIQMVAQVAPVLSRVSELVERQVDLESCGAQVLAGSRPQLTSPVRRSVKSRHSPVVVPAGLVWSEGESLASALRQNIDSRPNGQLSDRSLAVIMVAFVAVVVVGLSIVVTKTVQFVAENVPNEPGPAVVQITEAVAR